MADVPQGKALEELRRQRDEKRMQEKEKAAPTTKTTMGEGKLGFKKGGYVRAADGVVQRGKTRGKMV